MANSGIGLEGRSRLLDPGAVGKHDASGHPPRRRELAGDLWIPVLSSARLAEWTRRYQSSTVAGAAQDGAIGIRSALSVVGGNK